MASAQVIASSYPNLNVTTTAHENYIVISVYISREDGEYNNPNFQLKMEELAGEENKLRYYEFKNGDEFYNIEF